MPHRTISPDEVDAEVERFEEARKWARERILQIQGATSERIGPVEGKIFEAQAMMLDDPDLISGTISYIRENYLPAERAIDWRLLELRSRFADTAHVMALDRLADLRDIRQRVLSRLLGLEERDVVSELPEGGAVLVFDELTPSLAVQLGGHGVLGLLTATGSRASHSAVIARSLGVPCVVGIGPRLAELTDGHEVILDGATGRVIVHPTEAEIDTYRRSALHTSERERRLEELACCVTQTTDGARVILQANLDQPDDATAALRVGAEGVGRSPTKTSSTMRIGESWRLFRSSESRCARSTSAATSSRSSCRCRWRRIHTSAGAPSGCASTFPTLRAAVRAAEHGRVRILLPFIISPDEILRTREMLDEVRASLNAGLAPDVPLGIMIETPAALETVDRLAPHVDFLSLGTNDLTQYTLAVDRGNARLVDLFDPLHPALFRMYRRLARSAEEEGVSVSVCGDLAEDPVGVAALIGLGYRTFSLPPPAHPEVKEAVLAVSASDLAEIATRLEDGDRPRDIRRPVGRYLDEILPEGEGHLDRLSVV